MTSVVVLSPDELRALLEQAAEAGAKRAIAAASAPAPTDWLDADDAAHLVGVSRAYLRRLDVPRHGSNRAPRYRRSEVEAWLVRRGKAA